MSFRRRRLLLLLAAVASPLWFSGVLNFDGGIQLVIVNSDETRAEEKESYRYAERFGLCEATNGELIGPIIVIVNEITKTNHVLFPLRRFEFP